jgi:hypothetical protein
MRPRRCAGATLASEGNVVTSGTRGARRLPRIDASVGWLASFNQRAPPGTFAAYAATGMLRGMNDTAILRQSRQENRGLRSTTTLFSRERRRGRALPLPLIVALVGLGCEQPLEPLVVPEGCSPLAADVDCGLPFPSDVFLVRDSSLSSGHRVMFTGDAKMRTTRGLSADVTDFLPQDGFSRQPSIVAAFGVAIDQSSVPGYFADPEGSVRKGAPTALIDAETNERIPHFIDVDVRATDPRRQAVIMRPLVPLRPTARYVVLLSGLRETGGALARPPEGFRRLRDAAVVDDARLSPLLAHFEQNVFPLAKTAGISRSSLQLAWDFTTGSDEHVLADMLDVRTLVLAAIDETPPTVSIDALFEGPALAARLGGQAENTWRIIRGQITAPRVVEHDDAGAVLFRDASGRPALHGTTSFSFTAVVPASVRDRFAPGLAVGFGHGFFGSRDEVEGTALRQIANEAGAVVVAIDWLGMAADDIGTVASTIGDRAAEGLRFGERLPQAMANWWSLTKVIEEGLWEDVSTTTATGLVLPFRRPEGGSGVVADPADSQADNRGRALVARGPTSFVGMSNGHILGGVLTALDPRISRVVLHVGGAVFSHMMFRARPFSGFELFLRGALPDPLDQQKYAAHLQRQFDRFDPATYAPFLQHAELPWGPSSAPTQRQVLQQFGLGDTSVPNLGSVQHARFLRLPLLAESGIPPIFGLETSSVDQATSGVFPFDLGVDTAFLAVPDFPEQTPVHDVLRLLPEAREQMARFLAEGRIVNPCVGSCGVLPVP